MGSFFYLWRKYYSPEVAYWADALSFRKDASGLKVWKPLSDRALPHLVRWEGFDPAFVGYVSNSRGEIIAVGYDLQKTLYIVSKDIIIGTGVPFADLCSVEEEMRRSFLGVFCGKSTPFFISGSNDWEIEMSKFFIKNKNGDFDNLINY